MSVLNSDANLTLKTNSILTIFWTKYRNLESNKEYITYQIDHFYYFHIS